MTTEQESTPPPIDTVSVDAAGRSRSWRRVYLASAVGTTIEFYDFIVYGTAASLIFDKVFFSAVTPAIGVILSFATLAIGYAARPLGGLVFGHFGDRIGRKSVLIWTMVLMGVSTFLIGALPTSTQIGSLAPILLVILRLVQGIAVGGEWGGAALMSVEHAGRGRRGVFGSATGLGSASGVLLGYAAFDALGGLTKDQLTTWGWRLPFLVSALLIGVGLYMRLRVEESPVFAIDRHADSARPAPVTPLRALLRERPQRALLGIGVYAGPFMAQAIVTTFLISYATEHYGLSRTVLLNSLIISLAGMLVTVPFFAWLSDRVGRRVVYIPATLLFGVLAFFAFPMANSHSTVLIVLMFVIAMTVLDAATLGPVAALLSELYPTHSRYTGASVAYQFGGLIGGGVGPLLASIFVAPGGLGLTAVSAMIALCCVVSAACTAVLGDTRRIDLHSA